MHDINNIQLESGPTERQVRQGWIIVSILALCYVIAMSYLSILRFRSFNSNAFDMGLMIQSIWNTSHGRLLVESINIGSPTPRFWVAHWEFIYIPVALIYKIFKHPNVILICQSIFLSIGAFAVFLLAKDRLKNINIAIIFSICYLLFPAMQNSNLCDVHGLVFGTSLLIFTFYFLQKRQFKLFWLFAMLALMCREDISLILFMFGVYAFIIMKERKLGVTLALIGMVAFGIFYERGNIREILNLPAFVFHEGTDTHWSHLARIKEDPFYLLKFFAKKHNVKYVINLFGPLSFLGILSPFTVVLMAPTFIINMISSWLYTHDIKHIYTATITPIVFISSIYGFANLIRWMTKRWPARVQAIGMTKIMYALAGWILILSFVFFFKESTAFEVAKFKVSEHHKKIDSVIARIEDDASVSADVFLASRATEREEAFVFPDNQDSADYILYDFMAPQFHMYTREDFFLEHNMPVNDYILKTLKNHDYGVSLFEDGVILIKRGMNYNQGLEKLAFANMAPIENVRTIDVTPSIKFMGYNNPDVIDYWFQKEDAYGIYFRRQLRVNLFWEMTSTQSDSLIFQFQIDNGTNYVNLASQPVFGLYPTSQWPMDELIRDLQFLEIPYEFEPGQYTLSVYIAKKTDEQLKQNQYVELFDFNISPE